MIYAAVDGHVHLQEADPAILDTAASNLAGHSPRMPAIGVLMLTEVAGTCVFDALRAEASSNGPDEDISFWHRPDEEALPLLVVSGRQIVTAEGLELLALGTRETTADRQPLPTVLGWCRDRAALAVLPWGVGKWLGRRGAIVARAVEDCDPHLVALGDNGGRPAFWRVAAFGSARSRGMKILPGSDPLPLAGQSTRIGRFGFGMAVTLDERPPASSILSALRDPATAIEPFGAARSFGRFISDQAVLRLQARA